MRNIIFILISIPFLISSQSHKFYVSTTQIEYSEENESLQIISRIFTDDLERTLEETYHFKPFLASEKEDSKTNQYLSDYYQTHFQIYVNGKLQTIHFIGKTYEDNSTKSYLEIKNISKKKLNFIKIRNLLLLEKFDNQKNIIHLKIKNFKKILILTADNPSEVITLK